MNAISGALVGKGIYNMDEYRHGIERMEPRHYLTASYFERVFPQLSLCIEKGVFTAAELEAKSGTSVPLALPSSPGRRPARAPEGGFKLGQTVHVKNEFVPGHTRFPATSVAKKVWWLASRQPTPIQTRRRTASTTFRSRRMTCASSRETCGQTAAKPLTCMLAYSKATC
jgi:hypothetical protein